MLSLCRPGCVMRRGGVFLCCFGLRRGMFLQLLILLPPAAYLWGSNLILSPTAYFLLLLAKSMPSETRSLRKAPLLTKSMPSELKACRSSWKLRPLPAAHCGRTDFRYIVFYRRTKSCFDQTADPCSCGVSWLLRRAWDSSSPMLLSPFRLFCMIELRVVFQHFAG